MAYGDPGTATPWIKTKFLQDDCVTAAKLAEGAVDNTAIGALAVDTAELANAAVETAKIADDAVDRDKIAADVAGTGFTQEASGSLAVRLGGGEIEAYVTALALAAELVTDLNAHAADAGIHGAGADATNFPLTSPAATDEASLITLVTEMLVDFDAHEGDAEAGGAGAFHGAGEAVDCSLDSLVAPTTVAECVARLNDLKAKLNIHDGDDTSHTVGLTHQVTTDDATDRLELVDGSITAAKLLHEPVYNAGVVASNTLRVAANVADAELVTIGSDVYEVEPLGTDSTDDTGGVAGDFNNTTNPLTTTMAVANYPALGPGGTDPLVVGRCILIDSEIMRVTGIAGDDITFERGVVGTTVAVHADATNIFIDDGTALDGSTTIVLPNDGTLTPAVFTDALAYEVNSGSLGTASVLATGLTDNLLLVELADAPGGTPVVGASALATTESLAGVNNLWLEGATLANGVAAAEKAMAWLTRVPTADEVTLGSMYLSVPLNPSFVQVDVVVTATGVPKAWDGAIAISGNIITLDNTGGTDWAATDTLRVIAYE